MTTHVRFLFFAMLTTFVVSSSATEPFGADRHVARGVECQSCHGPDLNNIEYPTIETCEKCHDVKALVAKTADVKPQNPHFSPHYEDRLDCTNCHLQHEEPVNFCNQCHEYDLKVR